MLALFGFYSGAKQGVRAQKEHFSAKKLCTIMHSIVSQDKMKID